VDRREMFWEDLTGVEFVDAMVAEEPESEPQLEPRPDVPAPEMIP
jgi:hypothetical protein